MALPEWFARPEAIDDYARASEGLPMFGARAGSEAVGFLSLKFHPPVAAEAYVLGVRQSWHGQGIGRRMFAAAEAKCRKAGVKFLTVKTLAADRPDPDYAKTRAFYDRLGFLPLETFPTLWDADKPCLLMLKVLQ